MSPTDRTIRYAARAATAEDDLEAAPFILSAVREPLGDLPGRVRAVALDTLDERLCLTVLHLVAGPADPTHTAMVYAEAAEHLVRLASTAVTKVCVSVGLNDVAARAPSTTEAVAKLRELTTLVIWCAEAASKATAAAAAAGVSS